MNLFSNVDDDPAVIAISARPVGLIAIGIAPRGLIAIGSLPVGVVAIALGGMALGAVTFTLGLGVGFFNTGAGASLGYRSKMAGVGVDFLHPFLARRTWGWLLGLALGAVAVLGAFHLVWEWVADLATLA